MQNPVSLELHLRASVIIPAYNAERFVINAVKSALGQSLADIEVIVINDGSTDSTRELVKQHQSHDRRLVLIDSAARSGVSTARNRGLRYATGKWIALLDADDEYKPSRLERMTRRAESRQLDFLADNMLLRDINNKRQERVAYPTHWMGSDALLSLSDLLERDVPYLPNQNIGYIKPIMRREFLLSARLMYDETTWCAEDFLLYASALLLGARFGVMDDDLYIAYWRDGSLSNDRPELHQEVSRVNRMIEKMAREYAPQAIPLIQSRQQLLDYHGFRKALKARDLSVAMAMGRQISPHFIFRKLAMVLGGRRMKPR